METETNGLRVVAAMQNVRNGHGWESRVLTSEEQRAIDDDVRRWSNRIALECLADAARTINDQLEHVSPDAVVRLAVALYERRTPTVTRLYDETLRALIADERARARTRSWRSSHERRAGSAAPLPVL